MINRDEILRAIKPFVMQWIEKRTGVGAIPSWAGTEGGDELVRVTSADDNADYLNSKITAGSGITKTVLNPGGTETLEIAVNYTALDHGGLAGLSDDDHTQYLNTTRHAAIDHTGLVHAAVTVVDTGTIDFTLTGQQITASVIPTGIKLDDLGTPDDNTDLNASSARHGLLPKLSNLSANYLNGAGSWATPDHGSIGGLGDDDHTQYFLVNGTRDMAGHIIPAATDTYDLGSSSRLWRKGWLSELDTIIFSENTIVLLGGWFWVTKDQGSLPANVLSTDTTIDFGKTMTPGDFIVLRSSLLVEYMAVGTLVSGTVYNVTRDLDGSGANDWVAGAPFAVLGQTGDGRIEFNAYDTPRISIFAQGATYNAATELLRIGDLDGSFGISSESYGVGIGDYSNENYLRYDPTNGFLLKAGSGGLTIDENGVQQEIGSSWAADRAYGFTVSGTNIGGLGGYTSTSNHATELKTVSSDRSAIIRIGSEAPGSNSSTVLLQVIRGETGESLRLVKNSTESGIGISGALEVGSEFGNVVGNSGSISYSDDLRAFRGSVHYTGYIFVPLTSPLTSTSWDGDAKSTVSSSTLLDLSSVFGAPAGIKAVLMRIDVRDSATWGTSGLYFACGPGSSYWWAASCMAFGGDVNNIVTMVCPCDSNGDVYYRIAASGTNTLDVNLQIWGYWI